MGLASIAPISMYIAPDLVPNGTQHPNTLNRSKQNPFILFQNNPKQDFILKSKVVIIIELFCNVHFVLDNLSL